MFGLHQLHEAGLVSDLQVLSEKLEQTEAICILYDTSAEESFRFAADLYVSDFSGSTTLRRQTCCTELH